MNRSRRKSIGDRAQPLRPRGSVALDQTFDSVWSIPVGGEFAQQRMQNAWSEPV
jgi:hypothetical protein